MPQLREDAGVERTKPVGELREQAESGELLLPRGVSISRSLIESWYGGSLPGSW